MEERPLIFYFRLACPSYGFRCRDRHLNSPAGRDPFIDLPALIKYECALSSTPSTCDYVQSAGVTCDNWPDDALFPEELFLYVKE